MKGRMRTALTVLAVAVAVAAALPARAFVFTRTNTGVTLRWPAGRTITLEMQLGASTIETTLDGKTTWNAVGEEAARIWNGLADVNFVVNPSASRDFGDGNGVNNVFFSSGVYGESFGDALAVTVNNGAPDTGILSESDVVFDSTRAWNSYRGALRPSTFTGGTLYDLRRVAIHEFGHVLGLDHPDLNGQSVTAIMNSRISDLDTVQDDDMTGARAIYGPFTSTSDRLVAGSTMRAGQWLTSNNGRYRLYMQGDSNLVVYDTATSPWTALWWTGASAENGQAIFQSDGNFVVYDGNGTAIWNTVTAGNPGAFMVLQGDGNLVLYSAAGAPLWTRTQ